MTDLVLSDVHLELPGACRGQSHVTLFSWPLIRAGGQNQPQKSDPSDIMVDDDGDLIMTRRVGDDSGDGIEGLTVDPHASGSLAAEGSLGVMTAESRPPDVKTEINHHGATALADVGLQVWRGECLLADWLLHEAGTGGLDGVRTLLELGGGTGMATVVAAHCLSTTSIAGDPTSLWDPSSMIAETDPPPLSGPSASTPTIFCTDHHFLSLETALQNLSSNSHVVRGRWRWGSLADDGSLHHQGELQRGSQGALCRFRTLDWLDFLSCDGSASKSERAVRALLEEDEVDLMLAAGPGQPKPDHPSLQNKPFGWSEEDLSHLANLDLIIAVSLFTLQHTISY